MRKYILLLLSLFACSNQPLISDGSQKIIIRLWEDRTPNLLANNQMKLDVYSEQIVDFDIIHKGSDIYFAYTTDARASKVIMPEQGSPAIPITIPPIEPDPLPDPDLNQILYVREIEKTGIDEQKQVIVKRRTRQDLVSQWVTNAEVVAASTTVNHVGVWLRLFKGRRISIGNESAYHWELLYASPTVMDVTNIKVTDLAGVNGAVTMITNDGGRKKAVLLYNKGSLAQSSPNFEFFDADFLFDGYSDTIVEDLNTWRRDNNTYFAVKFGKQIQTGVITGTGQVRAWALQDTMTPATPVDEFQVQTGNFETYGVWTTQKQVQLLRYDLTQQFSRRWQVMDSIPATKAPQFTINDYLGVNNNVRENIYLGAVNEQRNFFQLYNVAGFRFNFSAPIIDDWNERYAFAPNIRNQVLYARVQINNVLIFAGLNSLGQWEPVQISAPPSVNVHPSSVIKMFFLEGKYPFTVFKQVNGAIYFLEGVS